MIVSISLSCGNPDVTVVRVLQCPDYQIVAKLDHQSLGPDKLYVMKRVERKWWFDEYDLLIHAIGYDTPKLDLVDDSLLFVHILGGPYVLLPLDVPTSTLEVEGASDRLHDAISRLAAVDFDSTATCVVGTYKYTPQPQQWLVYAKDRQTTYGKEVWLAGATEVKCQFEDSVHLRLIIDWAYRPYPDTLRIQFPTSQWWHVADIRVLEE